jgi:hypothetical protein
MIIKTTASSAWQKRRSDFNHHWLQNSFCTGELARWAGFIDDTVEGGSFTSERFESRVATEWIRKGPEVLHLARDYQEAMSPGTLFDEGPLSNLSANTEEWLRPLSVAIWKNKHKVNEKIKRVEETYKQTDSAFQELWASSYLLNETVEISNSDFPERFKAFLKNCQELGEAIHCLESSVKVT